MLRVVIVDDEPLAIRAMRRLLAAHPAVEVVGTADSLEGAVESIRAARPDLVFLDVDLGRGTGFEVLARLDPPPRIVFVTAHPGHAVEAFAVAAADYLLKPVEPARLAATLARIMPAHPPIALRTPARSVIAAPAEIAALCAEGDFTRVHLAGQPSLLILRSLTQFEAQLPMPPFRRLGRSLILNLDRVRTVTARDRDLAHVTLDGVAERLALGRVALARLRAALAEAARRA
jgi:two-component system LytT family response regulator